MKKFIALTFTRWFYIQLPNKKFITLESAFIYMILACLLVGYGVLANITGFGMFLYLIPFFFGLSVTVNGGSLPYWIAKDPETGNYKFKHFKIKIYPFVTTQTLGEIGAWRTQLKLLKARKGWGGTLTVDEVNLLEELEQKWLFTYGFKHIDFISAGITKFTPWLLVLAIIILVIIML